jgi:hypothetical protein
MREGLQSGKLVKARSNTTVPGEAAKRSKLGDLDAFLP